MKKQYCNRVDSEITIDQPDGRIIPCCWFDAGTAGWLNKFNLNTIDSLDDFRNDQWNSARDIWHKGCVLCKQCEEIGNESLRTKYKHNQKRLTSLHISLDFNCNMMCRTCGPRLSSKWNTNKDLINKLQQLDYNHYTNNSLDQYDTKLFNLLKNSDLSNIKDILIVGGEPFIAKNFLEFLQIIPNKQNVTIAISTNCSIFPKKDIINLLQQFKKCKLYLSIDATEHLFEVIRYGYSWETIDLNIKKLKKYFECQIHSTLSLYNINKIKSVIDYSNTNDLQFKHSILSYPSFMSFLQIPNHYRHNWKIPFSIKKFKQIKQINNQLQKDVACNQLDKFIEHTILLDNYNRNKFSEVNNEIWEIVNEIRNT